MTDGLRGFVRRCLNRVGYDLIRYTSHDRYLCHDIPGWFTANEARLLYSAIALRCPSRVLEIGTFLGRSTATIALALRDSGHPCSFTTIDFDVADEASFLRSMPITHGRPSVMPPEYRLAFAKGLSTSSYAREQLRRHGLDSLVTFASGDFHQLTGDPFSFIFADCLHDTDEIRRNAPDILRLLGVDGTLAVHDATPGNRATLAEVAPQLRYLVSEDSLALYQRR